MGVKKTLTLKHSKSHLVTLAAKFCYSESMTVVLDPNYPYKIKYRLEYCHSLPELN